MRWECWRLIHKGVTTLQELESWYSLDDVLDANDVLDWVAEQERKAQEQTT